MILILTAVHAEATSFIEALNLKRDMNSKPFQVFLGEHQNIPVKLIVSGMGKVRAASAATKLLSETKNHEKILFLNFGIAGGHKSVPIGEPLLINKISDNDTAREFFPDLLVKHNYREIELMTFSKVVSEAEAPSKVCAFDMEGSAFYETCSFFLAPDQMLIGKVISDHGVEGAIEKAAILKLIAETSKNFWEYAIKHYQIRIDSIKDFPSEEFLVFEEWMLTMNMTTAQRHILLNLAYKINAALREDLSLLIKQRQEIPNTKEDVSKLYNEIEILLKGDS